MTSNPFEILENVEILVDGPGSKQFNETLASLYLLVLTIGTIGVGISILKDSIKLMFSSNGPSRDAAKKEFAWKAILAIVLFSFTALLGAIYGISQAFI